MNKRKEKARGRRPSGGDTTNARATAFVRDILPRTRLSVYNRFRVLPHHRICWRYYNLVGRNVWRNLAAGLRIDGKRIEDLTWHEAQRLVENCRQYIEAVSEGGGR